MNDLAQRLEERICRWRENLETLPWLKRKAIGAARILVLVLRSTMSDNCDLHASALTYFTLMSIVPLLAMGLALASALGGKDIARQGLDTGIEKLGTYLSEGAGKTGQANTEFVSDFVSTIANTSNKLFDQIENINFKTLGGIGLIVVLWMAITMLIQVETSFNQVWDAPPRKIWRKVSDYLTIIIIVPFLAISASTINVHAYISTAMRGIGGEAFDSAISALVVGEFLPTLLLVATFIAIIMFVPNTHVKLKPGIIGGIVTSVAFIIWFKICLALQIGVAKYSKLYGGFATIPILLAWTFMSWKIILYGAELSYAIQHIDTFARDHGSRRAGLRARLRMALTFTTEMARRLLKGETAFIPDDYIREKRLSPRLTNDILLDLQAAKIVAPLAEPEGAYTLIRAPETTTVKEIVRAILNSGDMPELTDASPKLLEALDEAEGEYLHVLDKPLAEMIA